MLSNSTNETPLFTNTTPDERGHEPGDSQRSPAKGKPLVATVGPVVLDTHVTYPGSVPEKGKRVCEMRCSYGGGALNTSRAIRTAGGTVAPCFIIGRDKMGEAMKDELGDEFALAQFAAGYDSSRQSHIRPDGVTDTTRPPLELHSLPPNFRDAIRNSRVTIVAPMAVADQAFVGEALAAARFSIWQPSLPQLLDRQSVTTLGKLASVTVMNDVEAYEVTGESDPTRAVMALVEKGCRGAMVTSPQGVVARIDGEWASAPAHDISALRTSGAGDCFVGVFAWAYAARRSLDEALRLGQAAAARHVTAQLPLVDLGQWTAWANSQPKVSLARRTKAPVIKVRHAMSVAVGVAAMILAMMVFR
ncbi:MAG: carbohydrate kinase family protein [Pirellulales bacterium]